MSSSRCSWRTIGGLLWLGERPRLATMFGSGTDGISDPILMLRCKQLAEKQRSNDALKRLQDEVRCTAAS